MIAGGLIAIELLHVYFSYVMGYQLALKML